MKKSVLITGSTGLIGSTLMKKFIHSGWEIKSLIHQHSFSNSNVHNIPFDPQKDDLKDVLNGLTPPSVIVHNAGSKLLGVTEEEIEILKMVNVKFSNELIDYALINNVQKIIFSSTLSGLKKPLPPEIDESAALAPVHYYSESKYEVEDRLMSEGRGGQLKPYIFRISSPLPETYNLLPNTVIKYWIDLARKGQKLPLQSMGMRYQNFIAVQDIARVVEHAAAFEEEPGIYNLASPSGIYFYEISQLIANKYKVGILPVEGEEQEIWNISTNKLRKNFGELVEYTSKDAILRLLKTLKI
jgi:nucleoside-diphosphate-sugar epimerase